MKYRLRDNPLTYLTLYYFSTRFARSVIFIQLLLYFFANHTLSLTFWLCCVIVVLLDEYLFAYLRFINFDSATYLKELD